MTTEPHAEIRLKLLPDKAMLVFLWSMIALYPLMIIVSSKVQSSPWRIAFFAIVPIALIATLFLVNRGKVVVRACSKSMSIGATASSVEFNWEDIRDVQIDETSKDVIAIFLVDPTKLDQGMNFRFLKSDLPALASFVSAYAPKDNCLLEAIQKFGAQSR